MKYTAVLEIEQSISKISEIFADPDHFAFWQPKYDRTEVEAGGRRRIFYKADDGDEEELVETIESDELPAGYTSIFVGKGLSVRLVNKFEEAGANRTRWIVNGTTKANGIEMRLISFFMPGCFKRRTVAFMENFKAYAERSADIRETADSKPRAFGEQSKPEEGTAA